MKYLDLAINSYAYFLGYFYAALIAMHVSTDAKTQLKT